MMQRTAEQVGGTSGGQSFPQTLGEFTVSSEVIFCLFFVVVVVVVVVVVCLFGFVFSLTLVVKFSFSTIQPKPCSQAPPSSVTRSTKKQVIKSYIAELGLGNEARIYHNLYSVDQCPSEQ